MDINSVRNKINNNEYDLSEHAHRERQEEQITVDEIEKTLLGGGIIEQYPNDPRGKSCLAAGKVTKQPLHVVCGMRDNRLLIVTVYRSKPPTGEINFLWSKMHQLRFALNVEKDIIVPKQVKNLMN